MKLLIRHWRSWDLAGYAEVSHQVHILLEPCAKRVLGVIVKPLSLKLWVLQCAGLLLLSNGHFYLEVLSGEVPLTTSVLMKSGSGPSPAMRS